MTTTTLRLPPELEDDLKKLAEQHERSIHGEMIFALKTYVRQQKGLIMETELDTLSARSSDRLYVWDVYFQGSKIASVKSDTAAHACLWICRSRWIPNLSLSAKPAERAESYE